MTPHPAGLPWQCAAWAAGCSQLESFHCHPEIYVWKTWCPPYYSHQFHQGGENSDIHLVSVVFSTDPAPKLKERWKCHQVWNRSPAQVGRMRQVLGAGALGRPRGMGWEGRWEGGGGIGMGNTCKSMADSCQCMAKTATLL